MPVAVMITMQLCASSDCSSLMSLISYLSVAITIIINYIMIIQFPIHTAFFHLKYTSSALLHYYPYNYSPSIQIFTCCNVHRRYNQMSSSTVKGLPLKPGGSKIRLITPCDVIELFVNKYICSYVGTFQYVCIYR